MSMTPYTLCFILRMMGAEVMTGDGEDRSTAPRIAAEEGQILGAKPPFYYGAA
jgi:hypothetical protein